jgi:glycosyltransferase involved in cell wall biosynthesis
MPKVSVVIPTCNRPDLLKRAVRSVLAQTFQDFEIIIVDDGQHVRARGVVEGFNDPRIRYFQNESSLGGGGTRNRGIDEAKGEYVAFLDDDDEWMLEKLEKQVWALENASLKAGFVMSSVLVRKGDKEEINLIEEGEKDFLRISLRRLKGFLTSALMVKRSILREIGGFDTKFPSHQEMDLIVRISQRYTGVGISESLAVNYLDEGREHIGGDITRRIRGREMFIEKHREIIQREPALASLHHYWLGIMYRNAGDKNASRKHFAQSLRIRPNLQAVWGLVKSVII